MMRFNRETKSNNPAGAFIPKIIEIGGSFEIKHRPVFSWPYAMEKAPRFPILERAKHKVV